jgi:hypothetical protein
MDLGKLRQTLAKQGIRVHPADPALDMALMCETAVSDAVRSLETMLKATADRMAADQVKANEDAERRGAAQINRANEWLAERNPAGAGADGGVGPHSRACELDWGRLHARHGRRARRLADQCAVRHGKVRQGSGGRG